MEEMRTLAGCLSQGETVAPEWELGDERASSS